MALLRFLLAWAGLVALFAWTRPAAVAVTPWLETVQALRGGELVGVPPLWPALTIWVSFLGQLGEPTAALWIAILTAAAVPPAAMELARRLELSWAAALIIGVTSALAVAPFAHDAAPNALFAFLLVLVIATGLEWEAEPDMDGRAVLWLLCAGLAALTHEVGLLVLWTAALACAARSFPRAAAEAAVATGAVALFTLVAARVPPLPSRVAGPLETSPWIAGRWELMPAFFERFVTAPYAAGWVVLAGTLGAAVAWAYARRDPRPGQPGRPRAWALLCALSPAVAALVVWTAPTDLLVVVPASAIGLGWTVAAVGDWRERLRVPAHALVLAGLAATALAVWSLPPRPEVVVEETAARVTPPETDWTAALSRRRR